MEMKRTVGSLSDLRVHGLNFRSEGCYIEIDGTHHWHWPPPWNPTHTNVTKDAGTPSSGRRTYALTGGAGGRPSGA
jgi:hypothetical protein